MSPLTVVVPRLILPEISPKTTAGQENLQGKPATRTTINRNIDYFGHVTLKAGFSGTQTPNYINHPIRVQLITLKAKKIIGCKIMVPFCFKLFYQFSETINKSIFQTIFGAPGLGCMYWNAECTEKMGLTFPSTLSFAKSYWYPCFGVSVNFGYEQRYLGRWGNPTSPYNLPFLFDHVDMIGGGRG